MDHPRFLPHHTFLFEMSPERIAADPCCDHMIPRDEFLIAEFGTHARPTVKTIADGTPASVRSTTESHGSYAAATL